MDRSRDFSFRLEKCTNGAMLKANSLGVRGWLNVEDFENLASEKPTLRMRISERADRDAARDCRTCARAGWIKPSSFCDNQRMAGLLYVVATPIGNLEDITYRAVRVLKEADLIACEDTRQTRKLLDHYGIQKPTISYHDHNEAERTEDLTARLLAGEDIALVSDAGMPLVSDRGDRLVKAAVENGIVVQPVPGASAALAALAASGLASDAFHFGGFLPAKPGQRLKALEALADEPATLIF